MRRLTIILAAVGALMLVPAASAFGATITVHTSGTGTGTVTADPEYQTTPPLNCSGPPDSGSCGPATMAEPEPGEALVALHQAADPGSEFVEWIVEEADYVFECSPPSCLIFSFGGNAKVTAVFNAAPVAEEFPLTLKVNSGSGTVVSNPAGIECTGSTGKTCTAEFEEGAEVTLTASPAAGYRFYNWAACPGTTTGRQCKVTMSAAKEAKVNFKKSWQLTASKAGGSQPGIIKVLPTGVTCPYKCQSSSYEFLDGQEVTVDRYEPNGQLHFTEFTGGTGSAATCNGATTPCSFTLEADSSIEALFEANAQATLSLVKEGGGQAKITSSPAGIYCFNTCGQASSQFYSEPSAEEVTLSWTLGAGTSSLEWSTGAGTCTGLKTANGSCKVTMSAAKELVATLE